MVFGSLADGPHGIISRITRAGHSGGTDPIGSVPRFLQNFGS